MAAALAVTGTLRGRCVSGRCGRRHGKDSCARRRCRRADLGARRYLRARRIHRDARSDQACLEWPTPTGPRSCAGLAATRRIRRPRSNAPTSAAGGPGAFARASKARWRSDWSDDQSNSALGATSGQHFAAAGGRHPCAETVGALALDDRRLISTFHDSDSGIWRLDIVAARSGPRSLRFVSRRKALY